MALPGDLSTFTLTFGPYVDAEGSPVLVGATATLRPSAKLLHVATGQQILTSPVSITINAFGIGMVGPLPHTDNAALLPVGFTYEVVWNLSSNAPSPGNKQIAVPAAAGATIDYDLLEPTSTTPGVTVALPSVISVAGLSGAPTAQQLTDALDAPLRAASVAAVEDAETVAPTGSWDFAQTPTVAGEPLGSGGGGSAGTGSSLGLTAPIIKRGVYAPQGWGAAWYSGRGAASSERVEVVWAGDSTTAGDPSGGNITPITKLIRAKSVAAGYPDGGRGAAPRGNSDTAFDSAEGLPLVQSRSGFGSSDVFSVYVGLTPRSTTALDTITFQGKGTRGRLFYPNFNNGGRFSYQVNGGARVMVDPVAPTGIWLAGWLEITGMPGAGATNTITVRNEGGVKLRPISSATSVQAPTTGAGPAAGTYYYVLTVYNTDKTLESAPNAPGGGTTVNGSQTVNALVNNTTSSINGFAHTTGSGRTYAIYRSTSSAGPFQYVKDVSAAAGAQTTFTDDGTVAPNASRTPPATTADAADGSTRNDVKVTAEFYNDTGIIYHNAGVSGANAGIWFDVADSGFNQGAQSLFGLGPSGTNADQQGSSATAGRRSPRLVVINFGINDLGGSTADADALTLSNRLSLGIRMAQNGGADVLVIVPPLDVVNGTTAPPRTRQGMFRRAIWDTGVSHGCAVVDLNVALGPSAKWDTLGYGLGGTNPHPSATGYQVEADFIWDNLLAV